MLDNVLAILEAPSMSQELHKYGQRPRLTLGKRRISPLGVKTKTPLPRTSPVMPSTNS